MRTRILLVVTMLAGSAFAAQDASPSLDPAAVQSVRRMGDYLSGLHSFRVDMSTVDQKVTTDGQKVQFVSDSMAEVRRPNRLRSDQQTPQGAVTYRYDGQNLAVGGPGPYYAKEAAPSSLDAMIEIARDQYGIDAPAADLVTSRPADVLLEDVVSGQSLGVELVDGAPCEHLAFRGRATDWQIWIQTGDRPLPRRFVITTKDVAGNPEFTVDMKRWELEPKLGDELFRFQPRPGATRVPFLTPKHQHGAS
jgi:hypothetical protein